MTNYERIENMAVEESDNAEKLNSCPFCGSSYIFVRTTHRKDNINDTQYEVYCSKCSATGGSRIKEDTAIESWNRRIP